MSRADEVIAFVVSSDLYDIREDGTVFTKVTPQGHVGSEWRRGDFIDRRNGRYMMRAKYVNLAVSRVVHWKFKGAIPDGMTVDHINEIRTDNRPENLQLLTKKDNSAKSHRENKNRIAMSTADHVHNARLTPSDVQRIRQMRIEGMSLLQIAKEFHTSRGHISEICNRKIWKHI